MKFKQALSLIYKHEINQNKGTITNYQPWHDELFYVPKMSEIQIWQILAMFKLGVIESNELQVNKNYILKNRMDTRFEDLLYETYGNKYVEGIISKIYSVFKVSENAVNNKLSTLYNSSTVDEKKKLQNEFNYNTNIMLSDTGFIIVQILPKLKYNTIKTIVEQQDEVNESYSRQKAIISDLLSEIYGIPIVNNNKNSKEDPHRKRLKLTSFGMGNLVASMSDNQVNFFDKQTDQILEKVKQNGIANSMLLQIN